MEKIENVEDPQLGVFYLVNCVKIQRRTEKGVWFPVAGKAHRDGKYALDKPHYHIDWRFVSDDLLAEHRNFLGAYYAWESPSEKENAHYFSPIREDEVLEEKVVSLEYKRDHTFPETKAFDALKEAMKDFVMENRVCPHHKTNLKSCKPVNGVITCPQHGLKWDCKTGKQVA